MQRKLPLAEIKKRLKALPAWSLKNGGLHRDFQFENFVQAFSFMSAAALEAEKMNHHPDWSNAYGSVRIALKTHSAKGITELDFQLAGKLERLAGAFLK